MQEKFIHTIHSEKLHQVGGKYLGDLVYGANDGIITTFAVISGAAGAELSPGIVVILGLANLLADGISMGLSNFLSLRSERDFHRMERERENIEVEKFPNEEREEVRVALRKWGIPEEHIPVIVESITCDKKRWVDFMMVEELGIVESRIDSPLMHGFMTFVAFLIAGILPLIPYLFGVAVEFQFMVSFIATGIALFAVGSARSMVIKMSWFRAGLEMLIVGGLATVAAYFVGGAVKVLWGIVI